MNLVKEQLKTVGQLNAPALPLFGDKAMGSKVRNLLNRVKSVNRPKSCLTVPPATDLPVRPCDDPSVRCDKGAHCVTRQHVVCECEPESRVPVEEWDQRTRSGGAPLRRKLRGREAVLLFSISMTPGGYSFNNKK